MRKIEDYCGNCLVKSCCIDDYGNIKNPCDKIKKLIYKYGSPLWDEGIYQLEGFECNDSTSVFVYTDISFNEWHLKRFGKKESKKRIKENNDIINKVLGGKNVK